jgi:hypothetical protein
LCRYGVVMEHSMRTVPKALRVVRPLYSCWIIQLTHSA